MNTKTTSLTLLQLLGHVLIVTAIGVLAFLQIQTPYTDPNFVLEFMPYEVSMAMLSLLFWFFILRKTTPLSFETPKKDYRLFTILLLFLFIQIATTYSTTTKFNSIQFLKIVLIGIAVGINEEFIFRVTGLRNFITTGMPWQKALIYSALAFSLFHLPNIFFGMGAAVIFQLINAFLMGLVLGFIYLQTGSIIYPCLLHGLWDFTSFSNSNFGAQTITQSFVLVTLISVILSSAWVIRQMRRRNNQADSQKL